MTRVPLRTAPLSADRGIGLFSRGGHCILCRSGSGYHFIDADHEDVQDRSRLRMEKDCLGAVDIGILQVGQCCLGGLKASLDQADRRVVASPAAAVCSEVGLLVAHCSNRKAACLFRDLELMHACQCDIKGTGPRPGRWGKAANPACLVTWLFAGFEISVAKLLLSIAIAVLPCRKSSNT